MCKSLSLVFLFAWVMWLNADGRWSPGQTYESKGECDSQISVTRERLINGYKGSDWRAAIGQEINAIDFRNPSNGEKKTAYLVCYPSKFSPK